MEIQETPIANSDIFSEKVGGTPILEYWKAFSEWAMKKESEGYTVDVLKEQGWTLAVTK